MPCNRWGVTRPRDIEGRAFDLSVAILRWAERRPAAGVDRDLIHQLVRAVASVGANLEEARAAETEADFVHKVSIARKESLEAHYWSRLLLAKAPDSRLTDLSREINEVAAILTAIAPTGSSIPTGRMTKGR